MFFNGVEISCIGFGTWQTSDGEVEINSVAEAIKCGYRHIDTAAVYGNEESVETAIKQSGIFRKELFITSKFWNKNRGYESTFKAFEVTLRVIAEKYEKSVAQLRIR